MFDLILYVWFGTLLGALVWTGALALWRDGRIK